MQDTNLDRGSTKRSITFCSWIICNLKFYGNSKKEAERLTNTVRIFSKDIALEFGTSKCAHVTMKAGRLVSVGGMELWRSNTRTRVRQRLQILRYFGS